MLAVLRQRNFTLLWFAGFISMVGDGMLAVALPITVYELTGSALATGGILIANKVAALLLGSFAGVLVDRWSRQRTMVIANVIRALLLLPLLAVDADRVWIVYVTAGSLSAVGQFFRPAENALLPLLVEKRDLVPANALNALNDNLSRLAGPALGGLVAAWLGLSGVVVIDAATYLIAAVMIGTIAAPHLTASENVPEPGSLSAQCARIGREWREGLRLIRDSRTLRVVFGVFAIASLGEGVFLTALWVFIDEELGGGAREAGWLFGAQAVGGMIGAVLVGSWGKRRSPLFLLGIGALGVGLTDLIFFNYPAFVPGIWLGLLLMMIDGIPGAAFGTGYVASLQAATEDRYRGRVFGALLAMSALFMIAGALIAGVATPRLGAVTVLTLDSLGYIGGGLFALRALGTSATPKLRRRAPVLL